MTSALEAVTQTSRLENTYHTGKYHYMADPLFNWSGFEQTTKADANSTLPKQRDQMLE